MRRPRAPDPPDQSHSAVELDVLIVGAGVQGLWLLNDLTNVGYTAILIEKAGEIGGSQTLHSHGFIHRGFLHNDTEMARRLKATEERWATFLARNNVATPDQPSYFGFASIGNANLWKDQWERAGLKPRDTLGGFGPEAHSLRPWMERGLLRVVFDTGEKWVDTSELVKKLVNQRIEQLIYKGDIVELNYDKKRVESVRVEIEGKSFLFRPEVLILAAGEGNRDLLLTKLRDDVIAVRADITTRLRKSQMVVIKGNKELGQYDLREIALVVHDLSLFIVSRKHKDGNTIWLASYDVDLNLDTRNPDLAPEPERVQDAIANLFAILPRVFSRDNVRKMQWGVYTGVKAEATPGSGPLPHEWVVDSFGTENLFAVWPTKLTLAPEASERLVFRILDRFGAPKRQQFSPGTYRLPSNRNWIIGNRLLKNYFAAFSRGFG